MSLESVRAEITAIDEEIIRLIAERQALAATIAEIKIQEDIPVSDHRRKSDVIQYAVAMAAEHRIDPVPIKAIFELLIAMNEKKQRAHIGAPPAPATRKGPVKRTHPMRKPRR